MVTIKYELPKFTPADAVGFAASLFGITATAHPLPSERDQNFHLRAEDGIEYVLKIANTTEDEAALDLQNKALEHLAIHAPEIALPRLQRSVSGESIVRILDGSGQTHLLRVLVYIPGTLFAHVELHTPRLLHSLGRVLGTVDRALLDFEHPAAHRTLKWDLPRAGWIRDYLHCIGDSDDRALVQRFLAVFDAALPRVQSLRQSILYNDANDYNVLVAEREGANVVIGMIDFGDMVFSHTVCDLAVAMAYAALGKPDPLAAACQVAAGYHEALPLQEEELRVLYPLFCARMCVTVTNAAYQRTEEPGNEYLTISEAPAWDSLHKLSAVSPDSAHSQLRLACGLPATAGAASAAEILKRRNQSVGKSLSVSYDKPLLIVRGWMQHLYDETGRAYLDCVNNVAHVGHNHPRVVRAGQQQMEILNTNTRYLHPLLVEYAERLCATLPEPLRVCYFVCSGSEANELALRLSRAYTGRRDVIVMEAGYHGNTTSMIDISSYKFDGPSGQGAPPWVHKVSLADPYRGRFRAPDPDAGAKYAAEIAEHASHSAAFLCEAMPGCGGQIQFPSGYLREAYRHTRAGGAVCIADEVQTGFGRAGSHFWAFETQSVVPDIVTMGKPIGNGHPMGAVVTTREIADRFNNGMEYFNTFGGNPVSCAIGLAVLDVIRDERLQERAHETGEYLMGRLRKLMDTHPLIGDVRGSGLYIGVELVKDRITLEPAAAEASRIINRAREMGVLLSTDGPLHNVLKIKPPLVFSKADADRIIDVISE